MSPVADISPYPMVYVPLGVTPPRHLPPGNILRVEPRQGPDNGDGTLYGTQPDLLRSPLWQRTESGWWILYQGQLPQHLARMETNPRIVLWQTVAGARTGEWWRVPQLLRLDDPRDEAKGYVSALDRIYVGPGPTGAGEWRTDPELAQLQSRLLAIVHGVGLGEDVAACNRVVRETAIAGLAQAQHVSEAEMIVAGWLSELMQLRVLYAMIGRSDLVAELGAQVALAGG